MEDYRTIENETIESAHANRKAIYKKCNINNFILEENSILEECVFIGCHIQTMQILKIKKPRKIIFINCRIKDLKINRANLPKIQFIGCEIIDSEFTYSNLPGITFALELREKPDYIKQTIWEVITEFVKELISSNKKPTEESSVYRSTFLFCDMNDMRIDQTSFSNTELKHCNIEDMKIFKDVIMQYIDLRGTKILRSSFGDCRFENIRFNKGLFIIYWIDYLIWILPRIFWHLKYSKQWEKPRAVEKKDIERIIQGKIFKFRRKIKRLMYHIRIKKMSASIFADLLSSTDTRQIHYINSDFPDSYHFFWHIQDLDFIYNLKKKHPFWAGLTFWASNYMRSFGALLTLSFIIIYLFSLLYSSSWIDFGNNPISGTLYLSFKIFTNFGITPLSASNGITKILATLEIIIGYFALGILLSIIVFPFSRRTSLPIKNTNHETTDDSDMN